jgi:sterol-4alpha-carboxylate 3-dehydrogenase (decarboxylating)
MSEQRHSLVTGGCGFVGRHLVDALVARGDRVTVLDVDVEPWNEGAEYHHADITVPEDCSAHIEGVDTVFHNASVVHTRDNQHEFVWSVNVGGTENMLKAAREAGVDKFVFVSSASAVYEGKDIENGDESLPYSRVSQAPYADAKIAAEKKVLEQDGQGGMHTVAIRPHVVFGPWDNRLLPTLLERAKAGRLKLAVGRGDWLSDFTYVENLIDALLAVEDELGPGGAANGEAYFITNAEPMKFFDFVGRVLEELNLPPIRGYVPYWIAYSVAAVKETIDTLRGGDLDADQGMSRFSIRYMCTHHYFSIDKAQRDFGYEPRVSIEEGIQRTVAHLREEGLV